MQRMLQRIRVGLVPRVFGVAIAGVLLVIGILGWTTLSYIERDIDENARKQLDMAINLELALIDEHLERVKAQAVTLAANPKLAADLLEGDFAAVAQDLRRFKQAAETDILTVVDASGRVVARANGSSSGQILSVNGLVPLALQGTAIASPEILPRSEWEPEGEEIRRRVVLPIVPTEGAETRRETELTDALALVAAAPVRSPSGQVIGAVVAAEVLNQNFSIVDEVRERTGGLVSATIALDGVRVTTNVRSRDARGNPTGERALGTIYSIPVMESLRAGMEYRGRALVVGEWQKTIYVPLKDHTGRVIAGPYVGIPESTFSTLRERFLSTLGPVAGISVMLLIGAALFLGRILDRVFERLLEAAERASRGDLTPIDLGVRRNDEVGELARAFEGMTNGIRDLLRSLMRAIHDLLQAVGLAGQVSKRLGESSKRVSASIARVAKGAQDQSQSVADTMSIIAEVRKAIEQIAEGAHQQSQDVYRTSRIFAEAAKAISQVAQEAQEVSAAASQTLASARTGGMAVQKSLDAMTRISSSSAEVAESIRELGRRSQQIAEIVQLIREIADQTNLLALNAAIEAARAGQHGKGFAVVAGEVRNLAVRAGQATQEIAALVSAIQGGVERSAQAVEAGMRDVKEGAVLGEEARRALEEILSAMERTNEKAQAIAALAGNVETSAREAVEAMDHVAAVTETNSAATSEMAASSEQMSEAMTRIAAISEENALAAKEVSASMEEMNAIAAEIASSAQSLARIAQQLQEQAVRFKI